MVAKIMFGYVIRGREERERKRETDRQTERDREAED